jgi:hypothetical protein
MPTNANKLYWFRARRRGRGWGLPSSAPGWLFFLAWFAVLAFFVIRLLPEHPLEFILAFAFWSLLYVLVCYSKGEPMPPTQSNEP